MHFPKLPFTTPVRTERSTRTTRILRTPAHLLLSESARKPKLTRTRVIVSTVAVVALVTGSALITQSAVAEGDKAASTQRTTETLRAVVEQSKVNATAQDALSEADTTVEQAASKVDTSRLSSLATSLAEYNSLDAATVTSLAIQTNFTVRSVKAAAVEADRVAAEKAAADAAAAAQAAADARAAANTVDGAKATAERLAADEFGWDSGQFTCLVSLWQKESGWSYEASNSSSGAAGIPQALPGSKMASVGSDWETNATTQIEWGLRYISGSYGTPCAAWSHSQSVNWY